MTAAMLTRRIDTLQLYLSRTIAVLAGVCALSVFFYGVFLMLAVEHTAARTSLQGSINDLTLQLSTLETQYLAEMRVLTPGYAASLGYVTPSDTTAVFADSNANSLSFK